MWAEVLYEYVKLQTTDIFNNDGSNIVTLATHGNLLLFFIPNKWVTIRYMVTYKGTFIVLRLLMLSLRLKVLVRKIRKLGHNTMWFEKKSYLNTYIWIM